MSPLCSNPAIPHPIKTNCLSSYIVLRNIILLTDVIEFYLTVEWQNDIKAIIHNLLPETVIATKNYGYMLHISQSTTRVFFFNFETITRISPIQSHTLRQNFWHLIPGFKARPINILLQSQASRRNRYLLSFFLGFDMRTSDAYRLFFSAHVLAYTKRYNTCCPIAHICS